MRRWSFGPSHETNDRLSPFTGILISVSVSRFQPLTLEPRPKSGEEGTRAQARGDHMSCKFIKWRAGLKDHGHKGLCKEIGKW